MLQMSLLWLEKEEVQSVEISGERNKPTSRNRNQSKEEELCMCTEGCIVQTQLLDHKRRKTEKSDERCFDVLHTELAATKTGNV